jgi:predicted DsbA family dithiol-disulfide isomerase
MDTVEVYADIVCPFTHFALRRFAEARAARGLTVPLRVRAWPLEWVNGAPIAAALAASEIEALERSVAHELFFGFNPARFPQSSILALGLVSAAYDVADAIGEAVSFRLRDALFEEGRDIGDANEVARIGAEFGLGPVSIGDARARVNAEWECGRHRGVKGSPHFFVAGHEWFCPSLSIEHEGESFEINIDRARQREFLDTVLSA